MKYQKRICTKCGEPSIPELYTHLCQYHYNEMMWGTEWADKCKAEGVPKGEREK
jgi:hypothetical protein